MSGTATAIMVEFSGISAAAKQAATSPRPGPPSAMCDRSPLQQVQPAVAEGELDVVSRPAEDPIAPNRQLMQLGQLLGLQTEALDVLRRPRSFRHGAAVRAPVQRHILLAGGD